MRCRATGRHILRADEDRRLAFERSNLVVFERGWLSSNNVLFEGGRHGESVMVDTGYCGHADQTLALVRGALGGEPLGRIINTHLHSDHCGGNHVLQQAYGCAIDVPTGEASAVDRWNVEELTFEATGQPCPRFERTGTLGSGVSVVLGGRPWTTCASPGHDPHAMALHDAEFGVLISADALWENGFGVVFPELEGERAFDQVRATLDAFAALEDVRWVIPGHGSPFSGFSAALERAYERLAHFEKHPDRHAAYAAKVLIVFHLMAVRRANITKLYEWVHATPYFDLIRTRYFVKSPLREWFDALMNDLVRQGALRIEGSDFHCA